LVRDNKERELISVRFVGRYGARLHVRGHLRLNFFPGSSLSGVLARILGDALLRCGGENNSGARAAATVGQVGLETILEKATHGAPTLVTAARQGNARKVRLCVCNMSILYQAAVIGIFGTIIDE
jgi:hypothetical protein